MTTRGTDVLVIGAGVIGLTTAITFAEAGQRVLIRTAERPEETTSAAAGALWGPWMAEPADRALAWAQHTLQVLTDLATEADTGVRLVSGIDISNTDHGALPEWFGLLPDLRSCEPSELPSGYTYGHRYTAPLVDMSTHLAYLTCRLQARGGRIELDPVGSLSEVATLAPVVVNCAGVGAGALVDDEKIYPVRGQQVVVTNPGLTGFLEVDTGDSPQLVAIYPHGDHIVLGGTAEPYEWGRTPDPAVTADILRRCTAIEPRLAGATVTQVRVGLRPTRPNVRLDVQAGPGGRLIIHNYGHGGAGVSLSWGCAAAVANLAAIDRLSRPA